LKQVFGQEFVIC